MAESLPLLLPILPQGSGLLGGFCSSWFIPTLQTAELFVCVILSREWLSPGERLSAYI